MSVTNGRVQGNGLRLAYSEWHAAEVGPPLVLLHGITRSSTDWASVVSHLSPRRVIALDARGHGESDWDPEAAYVADNHFADVMTALAALQVERFAVAGFSMGGGVAMMLAAALPERVSRLVVVDSYPDPRMTPGSRRIARWVSGLDGGRSSFDPAISRQFRDSLAADRERLDLWSVWEAVQCPTLLVRGKRSDVLTAEMAEQMLDRQPRARLTTVGGVGHAIPLVKPGELAEALDSFLAALDATPGIGS